MPDAAGPFVVAALPGTYGGTIRAETPHSRTRFVWREGAADHPAFDPAGAARRIATGLRRAAEGGPR